MGNQQTSGVKLEDLTGKKKDPIKNVTTTNGKVTKSKSDKNDDDRDKKKLETSPKVPNKPKDKPLKKDFSKEDNKILKDFLQISKYSGNPLVGDLYVSDFKTRIVGSKNEASDRDIFLGTITHYIKDNSEALKMYKHLKNLLNNKSLYDIYKLVDVKKEDSLIKVANELKFNKNKILTIIAESPSEVTNKTENVSAEINLEKEFKEVISETLQISLDEFDKNASDSDEAVKEFMSKLESVINSITEKIEKSDEFSDKEKKLSKVMTKTFLLSMNMKIKNKL